MARRDLPTALQTGAVRLSSLVSLAAGEESPLPAADAALASPHAAEASFYVRGLSNHGHAPDLCSGVTFLRPLLLSLVQPFGVLFARGTCRGGDAAEGGCIGLWRWWEGTGI